MKGSGMVEMGLSSGREDLLFSNISMNCIIRETERGGRKFSKPLLILIIQTGRKRGWRGEVFNQHNRIEGGHSMKIEAVEVINKVVMEVMEVINKEMTWPL
jgi:hypothetical protein